MKALADYIHSKGMLLGVYTCIGTQTCHGGRPGSYGHYDQDAHTLAGWGIDLVKTDNCHHPPGGFRTRDLFANFSAALNATGHPMLFSLCEWGDDDVLTWGGNVGQMYRIQADHLPFWHFPNKAAGAGIGQGTRDIINYVSTIKPSTLVKQYAWIDPDFLETLFHPTMSFTDSRTEYSFWALWSAPLLIATDVRNLTAEKRSIIANPEVIAVNQDPLWTAGDIVYNSTDGTQIWFKPMSTGNKVAILFNSADFVTHRVCICIDRCSP
jgi:alpha-galactosidase